MSRYRLTLLICFCLLLAASCINPPYPNELVLQHIPTVVAVLLLATAHWWLRMSNTSFALVVGFLVLHVIGARWIYSYVPYDDWTEALFGFRLAEAFDFRRNHYDRLVHFAYGLLFAFPIREFCIGYLNISRRFASYIAIEFTMATSMIYELVEWGIGVVLAPDAAERYNGQQGDVWDAHKDMALASLGAIIAMAGVMLWERSGRSSGNAAQVLGETKGP
jgi:putative membrane protein